MTVPHRVELPGSPRIRYGENGITAERVFLTEWSDATGFAGSLLGGYVHTGGEIQSVPGASFPDLGFLKVTSVDIEPFDSESTDGAVGAISLPSSQIATHTNCGARVTVGYSVRVTDTGDGGSITPPGDSTITYTESTGFERVSIPARNWFWLESDPEAMVPADHDIQHALVIPTRQITYAWNKVDEVPHSDIEACVGRVNDAKFPSTDNGPFDAETVLFMGAVVRRMYEVSTGQAGAWSVEYNFMWRQPAIGGNGWNDHWRPGYGWGRLVMDDGTADGHAAYLTHDLTDLFPGVSFD